MKLRARDVRSQDMLSYQGRWLTVVSAMANGPAAITTIRTSEPEQRYLDYRSEEWVLIRRWRR